jgi:hypothetical protein
MKKTRENGYVDGEYNIYYDNSKWCECEEDIQPCTFHDDGTHPEVDKHHYRCKTCKKLTQIG